jgi:hypothetical protein
MSTINNLAPTNLSRNAIWRRRWYPGVSNANLARQRAARTAEVAGARLFITLPSEWRSILVNDLRRETADALIAHINMLGWDDSANTLIYDYLVNNRLSILTTPKFQGGRTKKLRQRRNKRNSKTRR